MLRAPVAADPVVDPPPSGNDRMLSPSVRNTNVPSMLIQLLQVSLIRCLSVPGLISHP